VDGLKQRIIGALVLVCLAVIFVPMIFDEPHSERQSTPITIPEEPPFPEVEMPEEPVPETENYGLDAESSVSPSAENATGDEPGYRLIEDSAGEGSSPTGEPAVTDNEAGSEPAPEEPVTESASESESTEEKAEFTRSLEGAWVVQLGTFGNEDNARGLRDKVLELGYGAHLQQVTRSDTRLTRVFSGPFVDENDAESAKRRLDEEFGLDSLITTGGK